MMWECAMTKHEVYRVALLKTFAFLGSKAKAQELKLIFNKIKSTPLNHTDKFIMRLLKTIAKNISVTINGDSTNHNKAPSSRRSNFLRQMDHKRKPTRRQSNVDVVADHGYERQSKQALSSLVPGKKKGRSSSFTRTPTEASASLQPLQVKKPFGFELQKQQKHAFKEQVALLDDKTSGDGDITNLPRSRDDQNTADELNSPKNDSNPRNDLFDDFEENKEQAHATMFNDHEEEKVNK